MMRRVLFTGLLVFIATGLTYIVVLGLVHR